MRAKSVVLFVVLSLLFGHVHSAWSAQNDPDIIAYFAKIQQEDERFRQETAKLEAEAKNLDEKTSALLKERAELQSSVAHSKIIRFGFFRLPQILSANSLVGLFASLVGLSYILLILTLILIFLFSRMKPEIFYNYLSFKAIPALRGKIPILREPPEPRAPKKIMFTMIIVFLILIFCAGAFAQEISMPNIEEADTVIHMTEIEKTILRLEKRAFPSIDIDIPVTNLYLKPWRKVKVDSPEYYFSLASLQYENRMEKYEQSLGAALFNFDYSRMSEDTYGDMLLNILYFLIEQKDESKLNEAVKRILPSINEQQRLYAMLDHLLSQDYLELAQQPLTKIIHRERDMANLLRVVDRLTEKGKTDWSNEILRFIIEACSGNSQKLLKLATYLHSKGQNTLRDTALSKAFIFAGHMEMKMQALDTAIRYGAYDVAIEDIGSFEPRQRNRIHMSAPSFLDPKILLLPADDISLNAYLALLWLKKGDKEKGESILREDVSYGLGTLIDTVDADRDMLLPTLICLRYVTSDSGQPLEPPQLAKFYDDLKTDYFKRTDRLRAVSNPMKLQALQTKIDKLTADQRSLKSEIAALRTEKLSEFIKMGISTLKTLVKIFIYISFVYVAIIFGWEATLSASENKTTVFFARAFEIFGIELLFTITGIIIGILLIIIGQLMQAHLRACMKIKQSAA